MDGIFVRAESILKLMYAWRKTGFDYNIVRVKISGEAGLWFHGRTLASMYRPWMHSPTLGMGRRGITVCFTFTPWIRCEEKCSLVIGCYGGFVCFTEMICTMLAYGKWGRKCCGKKKDCTDNFMDGGIYARLCSPTSEWLRLNCCT